MQKKQYELINYKLIKSYKLLLHLRRTDGYCPLHYDEYNLWISRKFSDGYMGAHLQNTAQGCGWLMIGEKKMQQPEKFPVEDWLNPLWYVNTKRRFATIFKDYIYLCACVCVLTPLEIRGHLTQANSLLPLPEYQGSNSASGLVASTFPTEDFAPPPSSHP